MPHYDVQLCKNGYLAKMEMSKSKDYELTYIDKSDVLSYLNKTICIEDGATLKQLLNIVYSNTDIFTLLLDIPNLDEFLEEAFFSENNFDCEVEYLELEWVASVENSYGEKILETYINFSGVDENEEKIALEFTPPNLYSNMIFKINDVFRIYDDSMNEIFSVMRPMTLLEVIGAVLREVTFFGSIENRKNNLEHLKKISEDFTSGTENILGLDEFEKSLSYDIKPCRICGKDTRCTCFGKPKDLCHECFKKLGEG